MAPVGLIAANDEVPNSESTQEAALNASKATNDTGSKSTNEISQNQPSEAPVVNSITSNEDQNLELTNVSKDAESSFLISSVSLLLSALAVIAV